MTKRNIIIIGVGFLTVVLICGGLIFVGMLSFNSIDSFFTSNDNLNSNFPISEIATPIQNEITDEIEINHGELFFPFWETWEALHEFFVDQPIDNQKLAAGAYSGLINGLEEKNIVVTDFIIPENGLSAQQISRDANTPKEVQEDFLEFWEYWVLSVYASEGTGVTYEYLMQRAIVGMVDSLGDQHTSYMDPVQYQEAQKSLNLEYDGIGAWVDTSTEYLTIISPMDGSPAKAAGLLAGDRVIAVDGEDMTGIDGNLVIRRILGPSGSKITLTIDRDDVADPFDVEIIRAHIDVPIVEKEILEGNIAYINLQTFGVGSAQEIRKALEELLDENPKGLILDLRNNGGGYLRESISISSEFISDGAILYEVYSDGFTQTWEAENGGLGLDIPLVVLVNEGSASASEIVAGAIQDTGRGLLVGTTTFGKGLVQTQVTLKNNQGFLRITVARWLTPNENLIQDIGLEPDYYIELTDEDVEAKLDPQLEKAIEILSSP